MKIIVCTDDGTLLDTYYTTAEPSEILDALMDSEIFICDEFEEYEGVKKFGMAYYQTSDDPNNFEG